METTLEEAPQLRKLLKEKPYKRQQEAVFDTKGNNML
jgi:hypothetical protein